MAANRTEPVTLSYAPTQDRQPSRKLFWWLLIGSLSLVALFSGYIAISYLPRLGSYLEYRRLHDAVIDRAPAPGTIVFELHRGEIEPRVQERPIEWTELTSHLGDSRDTGSALLYCGGMKIGSQVYPMAITVNARPDQDIPSRTLLSIGADVLEMRDYWKQNWNYGPNGSALTAIEGDWQRLRIEEAVPNPADPFHFTVRIHFDDQPRLFDLWLAKEGSRPGLRFEENKQTAPHPLTDSGSN